MIIDQHGNPISSKKLPKKAEFRESAGYSVDPDDQLWRPLTGQGNRDLLPLTQLRMQQLAAYQWQQNPIANRLIELPLAFLLADGVNVVSSAEDPDIHAIVQDYINRFWTHPINNWPIKIHKKVRELALFGEQCWPAFTNEFNGEVRLGYLDPSQIETVVTDPDNAEQPIGIVTRRNKKGEQRRYKVIVNGADDYLFTTRTVGIRETFTDGEAFYFSVNSLAIDTRGRSDLLPLLDWSDLYERMLLGEAERQAFLRSYVWDVTLKGATEAEVNARAKQIKPPSPGTVRVHNDSEIWNAITASLQSGDGSEAARLFRNHLLSGGTIPEHWYGGGGDVNRSTSESMDLPTIKLFSMRQAYIGHMLVEAVRHTIRQREKAINGREPDLYDPIYAVHCQWPEMFPKDTTKYAAAFQQVAVGAQVAMDNDLLSAETAINLLATVAERLGLKIDPAAEVEKARGDAARRAAEDSYPGPVEE